MKNNKDIIKKEKTAILLLEDGKLFNGTVFGAMGESIGEVCFNTGMTGYQEILTDPSYAKQIVTMTAPHIGNYGINSEDIESEKIQVKYDTNRIGFIRKSIIVSSNAENPTVILKITGKVTNKINNTGLGKKTNSLIEEDF